MTNGARGGTFQRVPDLSLFYFWGEHGDLWVSFFFAQQNPQSTQMSQINKTRYNDDDDCTSIDTKNEKEDVLEENIDLFELEAMEYLVHDLTTFKGDICDAIECLSKDLTFVAKKMNNLIQVPRVLESHTHQLAQLERYCEKLETTLQSYAAKSCNFESEMSVLKRDMKNIVNAFKFLVHKARVKIQHGSVQH